MSRWSKARLRAGSVWKAKRRVALGWAFQLAANEQGRLQREGEAESTARSEQDDAM